MAKAKKCASKKKHHQSPFKVFSPFGLTPQKKSRKSKKGKHKKTKKCKSHKKKATGVKHKKKHSGRKSGVHKGHARSLDFENAYQNGYNMYNPTPVSNAFSRSFVY